MPYLVFLAELATFVFFAVFCWALAAGSDGGGIFTIRSTDPVSRTLLRSAQAAFVIGYGALFVIVAAEIADQL